MIIIIKALIYLFLLSFYSCVKGQNNFLKEDYNFIGLDGGVRKLHKSNATLYELKCYIEKPCIERSEEHYKIISSITKNDFTILKLEKLDTLRMTTNPYPETRYAVFVLKNISKKELGYLPQYYGLRKKQIDSLQINIDSFKEKFFFTFFSDTYYNELFKMKKITNKKEAEEVVDEVKSLKYKQLIDTYFKTKVFDVYASGISAELLNKACIEKGFSPIGAGIMITKLMKPANH